jgi:hypothetical protein
VTGSFTDAAGGVGSFSGTFNLREFAVVDDALVARGILTGTLFAADGKAIGTVMRSAVMPVSASSGSALARNGRITTMATCDVLHLELGPLDLDLLGLVVHLDQIVLDIDAESGGGNLLGNLLCAVVGLLDGVGGLLQIADLLNQILGILTGLLG